MTSVAADSAEQRAARAGRLFPGHCLRLWSEQAVLDLALVGMSVARMVEVIPEPEIDVYRALDALQERGILTFE